MSRVRSITELCGLRVSVGSYVALKDPMQCKRCQRFGHTQRNGGYAPRCVACVGSHQSGGCSTPREQPQCCGFGGKHRANYRVCVKWNEGKASLAMQAPQRGPRNAATGHPAAPKVQLAVPSSGQLALVEGRSHVARGGVLPRLPPPFRALIQIPRPQPVTETPRQPKMTATRKKAGPKKPEPKPTAAAETAAGKLKKKIAASVKTVATKSTIPVLVVHTNPLEEISDLLDRLRLQACVELTRRPLKSNSSFPTGTALPRAVSKTVILFVAEYGRTP